MALFHSGSIAGQKFLVTGGAGFIGSHICEYLLQHGAHVRVLDNLATGNPQYIDMLRAYPNFEFIEGDIRDKAVCEAACRDIELVSHQAALGSVPRSVKDPVSSNEVNVSGFVNMLTAAKDAGVQKFIYASSSSVYGDEPNLPKYEGREGNLLSPYAVTKKTNELYAAVFAKHYPIKTIGLRYFNVFGPRQNPEGPYAAVIPLFVKNILSGAPVYINGDGGQTRDFTFVENAVQANIRGLLCENEAAFGEVYNIAVGERFSVNMLYDTICEMLSASCKAIYRNPLPGDIRDSLADISKAKNLLGYNPAVHFNDGLKQTVEYFKEIYKG